MLLAFDIGNTNIVLGVYDGDRLINFWRYATDSKRSADEIGIFVRECLKLEGISPSEVKDVIIASVVPNIMYSILHMIQKYFGLEPIVIGEGVETGINVLYDNPNQVGADRIVNAVAAVDKYASDKDNDAAIPLIIVDFGTATTFCVVTEKNEYLGGAILPGIKISADALYERAAKLTRVELVKPGKVICRNTQEAIQAGIVYGYVGSVDYIVKKMKLELVKKYGLKNISDLNIKVIATGGLSTLIAEESSEIDIVDKNLTLYGLNIIYKKHIAIKNINK